MKSMLGTLGFSVAFCAVFVKTEEFWFDSEKMINSKLRHFEIVEAERIRRFIRKRGVEKPDPSNYNRIEEVNIRAFNRNFRLFLTPKKGLLSSDFKAYSIENDKYRKEIYVNPEEFFEGHLYEAEVSRVSAHFDENNAMTGSIETADEIFMLEPAWRHLPKSSLNATIIYKVSDFYGEPLQENLERNKKKAVCGYVQIDENNMVNTSYYTRDFGENRKKRQISRSKNRCPVKLVADYLFFEKIGRKSTALAIRYLINVIDRVNTIYTGTVWEDHPGDPLGLLDQGLIIKEVAIHESYTPARGGQLHYNMKRKRKWDVEELLLVFTRFQGSNQYCLVHLFTYQAFEGGVLGLGYIASSKIGTSGGICSAASRKGGRLIYYNTALTSARSTYGDAVITREADIVTAHEFGHNFGSAHDAQTAECSPSSANGGSYIMHTYSVSGYDENNKKFSPCSKRAIKAVLTVKSDLCFQENVERFCGNQRVEEGEECDGGIPGDDTTPDPCCTRDCKLKRGKQCSPKNSPCCTEGCMMKSAGSVCLEANVYDCKESSTCSGSSGECPDPPPVTDGTSCIDDGKCKNGTCISFCETQNLKPCICENVTESCYRCCRSLERGSVCRPHIPIKVLSDFTTCIRGICKNGKCEEEVQDVVQHLWNIIDRLDINNFSKFLEDNLVGTIIALSLIVWIPASLIVHHFDKKKEEERQKTLEWLLSDALVGDRDRVEVVKEVKSVNTPRSGRRL